MKFVRRNLVISCVVALVASAIAQEPLAPTGSAQGLTAPSGNGQEHIPLVYVKAVDPTIVVDLRYGSANNIAGRALYQPRMPALLRPEVATRLAGAQAFLRRYNYSLKIWDAYRPKSVQAELWRASHNNEYVADPEVGAGSLHTWGIAVDATLTDNWNRPISMPTDFDDFTPAAMWKYQGPDPFIAAHLHLLQIAMRNAGFFGLRSEWWHFTVADWRNYLPPEEVKRAEESFGKGWPGN
jgi:D-alanyl-D-alanine dipeptidase